MSKIGRYHTILGRYTIPYQTKLTTARAVSLARTVESINADARIPDKRRLQVDALGDGQVARVRLTGIDDYEISMVGNK